jgi:hypothetical protein
MPTYDGIGETITHKLEIEGDLFLQDVEGGPNSTQVPLEIFSNFFQSPNEADNSRMLRLRVQNDSESNVSNSYVTDFGIRGEPDKDYFFITAPQNTSNVGDQNTFVISSTSNVGIGTTDPGHYRLLVNNSSTKHFGVPGNDTPSTGDTLVYNESGEWVYHFVEGTLPPGTVNNEILTWNGTNWVPNHSILTSNSNAAIGIGTYVPNETSNGLHVVGSVTATNDVNISGKFQGGKLRVGSLLSAVPTNPNVTVPGDLTVSGTLTSDEWIHTSNLDITGNINVDHDVLIDGTYQGTGMRLDGTLQNLRGAIPDLSVAGSITATGDIKTDQTFRGTDASITGTLTTSNITHGSELTVTTNLLMGPGTTLTASNIVGASPVTISSGLVMGSGSTLTTSNIVGSPSLTLTANTNVVAEFTASEKLIKYPRVNMTAATTSGYTASVSSELSSNWAAWKAFNGVVGDDGWHDAGNKYRTSDGSYFGGNSLGGYSGEWIKLQLPDSIKLTQIRIAPRILHSARAPKDAVCLGSTDGSNWYLLTSWSNASYTDGSFTNFYVNTNNYYSYIAIVTTQIDSLDGTLNISEIEYYGYPENDLGDGTDVIFKSVPNTPKTDFLDVYYDAKEYESGNITDESGNGVTGTIGSSVSYTSTEPKAWNFDGTVNGTVSASLTTPGGDWPHTHAIWFKADSITTTQTTNTIGWFGTATPRQRSIIKISPTYIGFDFDSDSQDATLNVQTGIWYHAVFVYPGGGVNNAKIYVNGFDAGATGGSTNAISLPTSTTLYLANQTNSFNPYFNGSIANYRLYDRPLSADEVWELYGYQKAYFSVSPDVVTYKAGRVGIGTSEPRAVLDVVGTMMAKNIAFFHVIKDDASSFTGAAIVNYNNVLVCVGGQYSGGIFTVKTTGYYYFYCFALSYTSNARLHFRKNGTNYGAQMYSNGSYNQTNGNVIVYMNEGDTMDIYLIAGASIHAPAPESYNGFGGYYLSS